MTTRKRVYRCDAGCWRAARVIQRGDAGLIERRLCLECFARLAMSDLAPRFSFIVEAPE